MAWPIRSLDELSLRVRGAFRAYLPGTDSALANNTITIIGKVVAALAFEFELRMAALSRQMFLTTATGRFLALHCADVGIYRRPAATASGALTGTGMPGQTYSAGLRFVSGSSTYVSTAPSTADGSGAMVVSVASEMAGAAQNRASGGLFSFADPGLEPTLGTEWIVDEAGLGGGADIENDDSLRERGLQRKRNPPGGGTLTDYERIVRSVPGVMKAWAYRVSMAPGAVTVFFLFEGRDDFMPEAGDVAAVQAVIDAQRLIRVDDSVATAPVARPIDVDIEGLSYDTLEIRAGIEAAIRAMFLARCRPGLPGDTFSVSRSWISEAISGVTGEDRHRLVAPAADILLTDGQFPTLGVVDYGP